MSEALNEVEVRESFTVDNDMKAEWVLEKIRRIRKEQQKQKDELNRQMQFYIDQMKVVDERAKSEENFFYSMLTPYFADRIEQGFAKATKTQTVVDLPSGRMILKRKAPEFERNNKELLPWIKANRPELVKVEESPNWAELKKTVTVVGDMVVTKDGEVVPGVKVTEREDEFEVEVD